MRFFKIVLLLTYLFLCLSPANAEVVGGHDRQRLSQLFFASLQEFALSSPIRINQAAFPETLAESDTERLMLYGVLVEEGLLKVRVFSGSLASEPEKVQRLAEFSLTKRAEEAGLLLGRVIPRQILTISPIETDPLDPQRYQVTFEWLFSEPEPWLWAPALDSNNDIQTFLRATQQVQIGTALFEAKRFDWQLLSVEILP